MKTYPGWLSMAASNANLALADALGAMFAAEPCDAQAFTNGVPLYPAGTTFSYQANGPFRTVTPSAPHSGRYVGVCCTQAVLDAALEFVSDGPYPILTARGLTGPQIAAFKAAVKMDAGPRAEAEPRWSQFLAAQGYTMPGIG